MTIPFITSATWIRRWYNSIMFWKWQTIFKERKPSISHPQEQRKRFTVSLYACSNGRKLPAYIVFKERNGQLGPCVLRQSNIPNDDRITATNGWMMKEEILKWFCRVWGNPEDDVHRLLMLDHCRPHTSVKVKQIASETFTDLVFILACCTSLAQPLDVSINKLFLKITYVLSECNGCKQQGGMKMEIFANQHTKMSSTG